MANDIVQIRVSIDNKILLDKLRVERMERTKEKKVNYDQILTDILNKKEVK